MMMRSATIVTMATLLPVVAWLAIPCSYADVRLPAIFGDHMVLQRDQPLPVWGWADPGERVEVSVGDVSAVAFADREGNWKVVLPALSLRNDAVSMTVAGDTILVLEDLLIGDVWLCSGQSNMEFGIGNVADSEAEIAQANDPQLRLFDVSQSQMVAFETRDDTYGRWVSCNPRDIMEIGNWKGFSAVGYYFGRELRKSVGVPIGLVSSAVGGTPAEAWTSLEALQSNSAVSHYADTFLSTRANLETLIDEYESVTLPEWGKAREEWKRLKVPGVRAPRKPISPANNHRQPTVLFNSMINPIIPMGMKGVIWYQGETNARNRADALEYATLFPVMIQDWRSRWGQGEFPFLFVQLAGWGRGFHYPELRESQRKALSVPNTAMAIAHDIGDFKDIHPKNKQDVGKRLSLLARSLVYDEAVAYSGPTYASLRRDGSKLIVAFDHVGEGLVAGPASPEKLSGFEIEGKEGVYQEAEALIVGSEVLLWSKSISEPVAVRYAWAPFSDPAANLYNASELPAAPFSVTLNNSLP